MKKIIAVLTSMLLFGCLAVQAQEDEKPKKKYDVEKKKIYEKSYALSGGEKVKISNQFGFVKINTWSNNEVKVSVEMIATAKTEAHAKEVLEALSISDKKNGNVISFKSSSDGINGSQTMEINYTIHLPNNITLDIKNEFGATTLPDYTGSVDLTSKFGSLTTGKLTNVEDIQVEFGKANIQSISNGTATFKFSKAEVGNLIGTNTLKFEFCQKSKVGLDNNATHTTINESYSTLNIKPAANFNASFDVRTSFGSFRNRTGTKFTRADEEPESGTDSDKEYEGQLGSGTNKVKIKSSFGTIILGEAKPDEMRDEDDEPKKKKKKTNDDDEEA